MRVRFIKAETRDGRDSRGWFTLGREYTVLAIDVSRGEVRYRIAANHGTPALFEPELFEITDPVVPGSWAVATDDSGGLTLQPEAWSYPDFWEDFFNQEPKALQLYETEKKKLTGGDNPS